MYQTRNMKNQSVEITTKELELLITQKNELIIDLRPVEAYNGWKLNNEKRSGHIKGAISFPFIWTNYKFELPEFLKAKNITQEKAIILYGDSNHIKLMADMLTSAGYHDVKIYSHFLNEWNPNENLPMDYLPGYQKLVYPQWLQELKNDEEPIGYEGNNYVICHAHYDNYDDYLQGHIPGALAIGVMALIDFFDCAAAGR